MVTIPLSATPSQIVRTIVADQNTTLIIYDKNGRLYADVSFNGQQLVAAALCHDIDPILCRDYLAFSGNFIFVDTLGNSDPTWDALGSRYQLLYLTAAEYALFQQ